MNSDHQRGDRGAHITPSPRRSIHGYSDTMGRYGLNDVNNKSYPPLNEQRGFDVVDNVMSKPVRETCPLPIRHKNIRRTNSCPMQEDTDDDSNVLSKSLPSILPSHLSSSDDLDLEEQNNSAISNHENIRQGFMNISNTSSNLYQSTLEESDMYWRHHSSNHQQSSFNEKQPRRHTGSDKTQINILAIISLFIGVAAVLYYYADVGNTMIFQSLQFSSYYKSTRTVNYEKLFENNMRDLQKKYNIDSDAILKLKTGISTISSKMDTGSFIFVYNSNTKDFDPSHFDKFINEVASATARYLRNETSAAEHTVLSSYLHLQEHEQLIDMYRDAVDRTGVLLVKEVDSVPSDLAMAFHYYCDEYDPLVKRSAIFFTLDLINCSNSGEKTSTHDFIEKCLAGKWKTVPSENMRPLLTRLVNVIIDLTSVF